MATDGSSNMEDNFYVSDAIIEALNSFVHEGVTRGSVSINGRRVCWVEAGSGQPTVVLEAGRNDISLDWARVIALLARQQVHVVAYDRAGLGMSDPAPTEAVLQRQLADLAAVITHTANGRCILVGHSWGGMLAQLLAFYHPGFVSGMVLVDPAHEDMAASLPAFVQGMVRVFPRRLRPVLNVLGIVPIIQSATARQRARRFTEDLHTRDLVIHAYHTCARSADELQGAVSDQPLLHQLRASPHPFPDIPIVILSATQGAPRRMREHWTALQANLAAMASCGKHVIIANADHAIPQKQPDPIVDAILEVAANRDG